MSRSGSRAGSRPGSKPGSRKGSPRSGSRRASPTIEDAFAVGEAGGDVQAGLSQAVARAFSGISDDGGPVGGGAGTAAPFKIEIPMPDLRLGMGETKPKYVAYTVHATRGEGPRSHTRTITTRYSEIADLNVGMPIPDNIARLLPKKKMFGDHFSAEFVGQRRAALEQFLQAICLHPTLRFSVSLARLLEPEAVAADEEQALQGRTEIALYLRAQSRFAPAEPLPQLGWRRRGQLLRFSVADREASRGGAAVTRMVEWSRLPRESVKREKLRLALTALTTITHPNIAPALLADVVESDAGALLTVREEAHSLLDQIAGTQDKWKLPFGQKYLAPTKGLPPTASGRFAHHILQGLGFLHRKKIPYGMLAAGNVLISGGVARLSAIEDGVCGFDGRTLHLLESLRKVKTLEHHDVYLFGRVFHHMVFGAEPTTTTIHPVEGVYGAEILNATLTEEGVAALPTVDALLKLPSLEGAGSGAAVVGSMKSSGSVSETLAALATSRVTRIKEAQAILGRHRRELKKA